MTSSTIARERAERRRDLPLVEVRTMGADLDWKSRGDCFGDDDDTMFPRGVSAQKRVAARCQFLCEVQEQCLAYALDTGQVWGVWGGSTEAQRRKLARASTP